MRHEVPVSWSIASKARIALFALFAITMAYTLWPLREPERAWNDFAWIFVAGRAWWQGVSPYDFFGWADIWAKVPVTFTQDPITQPYMYPPHWVVIAMPFSLLSLEAATRSWDSVNILALLATFAMMAVHLRKEGEQLFAKEGVLLLIVLATLSGSVRYALWESQMSFVPTLAIVVAFWAWPQKKTALIAVCTFFAMLKPQLGTLPLAFLLLNGAHTGVAIGGAALALVGFVSLLPAGIADVPAQYADCVVRHMAAEFNEKSTFSNISALWPSSSFTVVGPLLGASWIVWLSLLRRQDRTLGELWFLMMVIVAIPAFMPLHAYDFVIYTPLVIGAYAIKPRAIVVVLVLLVQAVGRVHVLEQASGIRPIAPFLTLGLAVLCLYALSVARAQRVGSTLGDAQPHRVPFGESS